MCGIAGMIGPTGAQLQASVEVMRDRLTHRGPDDQGLWSENNVALAHRRLSIVDLSPAGHQPMSSADERWIICYNGEIYNAGELRQTLKLDHWRGTSDTEVLIECVARWGVADTLPRLIGMFAFAAFDRQTRQLWLARDRLGIKPLYYGWHDNRFMFASEMHSISAVAPGLALNMDSISSYLRYSYVPSDASIYRGISKLRAGHFICLDTTTITQAASKPYWRLQEHVETTTEIDEATARDELHDLLRASVEARLIADVPLGAFLSGGYDSSLVCALMQELSASRVKTFTIGFSDPRYNEATHAKQISEHLGTEHTELYVTEDDLLRSMAKLPQLNDEPFADASILPTFLVSELAREHVKVCLSGDGGDELFWGYNRYADTRRIWKTIRLLPPALRRIASRVLQSSSIQSLSRHIPAPAWGGRAGPLNQKLTAASELLNCVDEAALYHAMLSHWKQPESVLVQGLDLPTAYNDPAHWTAGYPDLSRMALQDTLTYLPDDILTKVDRASMAVSLEARVPLLDHRIVEFAAGLSPSMKVREGRTKYLLRQILYSYVPAKLVDRPKTGFGVPLDRWLRGPLQEWARDLLNADRLQRQNILHPAPITQLLNQHLSGEANNAAKLWDVLMLQSWLDQTGRG
jgi:asparagine synthase (glutamine-hydrolysing)